MGDPSFLLGFDILIHLLNDADTPARRAVERRLAGEVVTSVIAYAEVMRGLAACNAQERAAAGRLFAIVQPLPFDPAAARHYAALPFRRGSFDRPIAVHALALGLTLVPSNACDCGGIPGLRVEDWTQ